MNIDLNKKIANKNIVVTTNTWGEISSIKFNKQEILHQGKNWWFKTYPIIWPNISFSQNFVIDDINYKLPKHGFWKELSWKTIYENNSLVMLATHFANDLFPFNIDIEHKISIIGNQIVIDTKFTNFSKSQAYFSFGHHPAFITDEQTMIEQEGPLTYINIQGQHVNDLQSSKPIKNLDFGKKVDTYCYKNIPKIDATFTSNNLKINLQSLDFTHLLIWKKPEANFICVEPMHGEGDHEYNAPKLAKNKLNIVKLEPNKIKHFSLKINISSLAKQKNN